MLCGDYGNAKVWRDGGFDSDYRNTVSGVNYRMSNMQAAVGLAQLERFDELLRARLLNVDRYRAALPGKGKWLFCVETEDPRGLQQYLKDNGVESRPIFTPLHLCPAFRVYTKGSYRNSERIWERHLCLPTGPHLTEQDQTKIIGLVREHGSVNLRKSSHRDTQCAA